ncbi:MAG: septum formation protein Maf [Desulfobacterales bacterium]|nr:septum formation protein Maf [Desulfobacterales bacterium]MCP4160662.1 septum formation protein Maf [Deltaproteobacteria bacterium]
MFILGSKSPRRKALLKEAGLKFEVISGDFDEAINEPDPKKLVENLSYYKAQEISENNPDRWVLGADTVVYIDGTILEKPENKDYAREMISKLSGNKHTVLTGYTIYSPKRHITKSVETSVYFKDLTKDEIEWYISTEEPYDKAGGYAIQGLGTFMIKGIEGSYSNVVGLPVSSVIESLISFKVVKREIGKENYSSY